MWDLWKHGTTSFLPDLIQSRKSIVRVRACVRTCIRTDQRLILGVLLSHFSALIFEKGPLY